MLDVNEILKEKNVIRRAYLFGIYVGLYGHIEWSGWIREVLESIYREAIELELYDKVREAYREGKEIGRRERLRRIYGGLIKEEAETEVTGLNVLLNEDLEDSGLPRKEKIPKFLGGFRGTELPRFLKGFLRGGS
ncbi:hypothetical protein PNA2_1548 [Pyrococcus sp. NA2]|uniref:hypothetical protein n=1 Tax=Pyrococcus sp. (strain NA2) TaxID=342949 RepID=UPI000209B08C|nr:hypothetical protein [Pyrococcus sp. NA2]AEC52463.1 hypothetical protein PNA2_1548 [Pyrococcus sp. NA2]